MEESIKNTEKAILDKEQYLKLAHTRLDIRHKRPNIELVYDPAQKRLIEEIREIECEIQRLQERYVRDLMNKNRKCRSEKYQISLHYHYYYFFFDLLLVWMNHMFVFVISIVIN